MSLKAASVQRATSPIVPPKGRPLVTLKDAANYIQKLPKAEQDLDEWQAAVEALLLVVELNGPTMMARIGFMRALNRGYVREFDSSRKDTHWGKRKLKRDQ
jgi:hypothetical protein